MYCSQARECVTEFVPSGSAILLRGLAQIPFWSLAAADPLLSNFCFWSADSAPVLYTYQENCRWKWKSVLVCDLNDVGATTTDCLVVVIRKRAS